MRLARRRRLVGGPRCLRPGERVEGVGRRREVVDLGRPVDLLGRVRRRGDLQLDGVLRQRGRAVVDAEAEVEKQT